MRDLNVIFASALAARPAPRGALCGGTELWRENLHSQAQSLFRRQFPDAARTWRRRSRDLRRGLAADDPRRAVWRAEFRSYLAKILRWYRSTTQVRSRASRSEAFSMEAERIRIFGEDA